VKNLLWCVALLAALVLSGCNEDEEPEAADRGWWSTEVWGTGPGDVLELSFDGDSLQPAVRRGGAAGWTRTELDVSDLVAEYRAIFGADREPYFQLWAAGGPDGSIHLAGDFALVYRQDGASWERVYSGLRLTDWQDVWATGEDAFIVGTAGKILRRTGDTYVLDEPVSGDLLAVWGSGPGDVWAVGDGALHWYGGNWMPTVVASGVVLAALDGRAADDIYAAGETGLILHYDGQAWTQEYRHTRGDVVALACLDAETVMALAVWPDKGGTDVLVRTDGWRRADELRGVVLDALWGAAADDVWASGYRKKRGVLYHWDGLAWAEVVTDAKAGSGLLAP
jgi:hypothetical protein